jgi:hypothetical protein
LKVLFVDGLMGVTGVNVVVDGGWLIGERFVGDATEREERLRESEEDVRPNCCSFGGRSKY